MRWLFVCYSWIVVSNQAVAQSLLDSLKNRLQRETAIEERAALVDAIAENFFTSSQYDSLEKYGTLLRNISDQMHNRGYATLARVYLAQSYIRTDSILFFKEGEAALRLSKENENAKGVALMCLGLGSRLLTLGQYDKSTEYLLQGFRSVDESRNPELRGIKSDLIRTVSAVYHHQGKYTEALEYALTSSRLAEESQARIQILKSYLNLSGLYGELSSPDNGLGTAADRSRYHVEAKRYMRKTYEYSIANASLLTRGATAFNLGALYTEDGVIDSATYFLDEAIRLGKSTNFHELLSNAYRAKSSLVKANPDSSLFYLNLASREAQFAKNPISEVATKLDKTKILVQMRRWEQAQQLAQQTLQDAIELNLLNDMRSAYKLLSEIYLGTGSYRDALEYYKKYEKVKDSIVNEKNYARIEELRATYESELKDGEIKSLEQKASLQQLQIRNQQYLLVGILIAVMLLVGLSYLYYRQKLLKQKQRELEIENRFLRLQLDPHFLSNALVSIQQFLIENDSKQAANYLTKFSRVMRQQLEHSREEHVTVEEEVELLTNYLDIQKLRFKNSFSFEMVVDRESPIMDVKIPAMFVQPFVENAVEHGASKVTNGKIVINFSNNDAGCTVRIEDNGPGVQALPKSGRSLSTQIMQERIQLLNKGKEKMISLKIQNLPIGGTQVVLYFPPVR